MGSLCGHRILASLDLVWNNTRFASYIPTQQRSAPNARERNRISGQIVYGTQYQYGPICTAFYEATGSAIGWVNDVAKAKDTFTIELLLDAVDSFFHRLVFFLHLWGLMKGLGICF
jgi:hypothetical protein